MTAHERVTTSRDVGAIQIPDGSPVVVPKGTPVMITQQLGSSYTIMTDYGGMFRIDERNADALGKEVPEAQAASEPEADQGDLEQVIWDQMKHVFDPEIPVNIVDLGLIYDCRITESETGRNRVEIKMTLTAPGCGMGPVLAEDVRARIGALQGVDDIHVEVVFDPPWNPNMMTEVARLQLGFM